MREIYMYSSVCRLLWVFEISRQKLAASVRRGQKVYYCVVWERVSFVVDAFYGENGYTEDGSNGQVMIYVNYDLIPLSEYKERNR